MQQPNQRKSIPWNFLATLLLIGAIAYAWPDVLAAIEKGAYAGAQAGAEAGAKAAITAAIDKAKVEIRDAINEALPWRR